MKRDLINSTNYEKLMLDQLEVQDIQINLKLKKQNILRCYELLVLTKLDPNDKEAQQKFNQEVKRKFYY